MRLIVRSAEENDVQAILDILNFEIVHSTSLYEYEPRSYHFQLEWLRQKQAAKWPVFVAERDGVVVGLATFGTFRAREAYQFTVEHSIYIRYDMRGQAIGDVLMQRLVQSAKDDGYHTMIGGIDATNEASIAFHRKYGFEEVGRLHQVGRKFEKWLDLVFMQVIVTDETTQNPLE